MIDAFHRLDEAAGVLLVDFDLPEDQLTAEPPLP